MDLLLLLADGVLVLFDLESPLFPPLPFVSDPILPPLLEERFPLPFDIEPPLLNEVLSFPLDFDVAQLGWSVVDVDCWLSSFTGIAFLSTEKLLILRLRDELLSLVNCPQFPQSARKRDLAL